MSFRVGIIGAGWYGCHLAVSLLSIGFSVRIFESKNDIMQEASGNNQFRLHQGFHYARHKETRLQSRDGFQRFVERYPTLSVETPENIYAVPRNTSLIDFGTYKLIMAASGIDFQEMAEPHPILKDVDGCLLTNERVIMLHRARSLFKRMLGKYLSTGETVTSISQNSTCATVNGERFDYVIDATWGQLRPLPIEVFFEPTLLLYYESNGRQPAITLVDGPLASIYPTEDQAVFTLSSVPHTPLGRFSNAGDARLRLAGANRSLVESKRQAMEDQITRNVPAFRDLFRYLGVQFSVKTKSIAQFDDRSCYVFRDGRIFSVMSGKIDTIFFAAERILSMIEGDLMPDRVEDELCSLRSAIIHPVD